MVSAESDGSEVGDTLIGDGSLKELIATFLDRGLDEDEAGHGAHGSRGRAGEAGEEQPDSSRVRAACILWDLCASRQHAESLLRLGLLAAVRKVLCEEDLEEQRRLAEVLCGLLGNLATHKHLRQAILHDQDGRTVIRTAVQWFVLWVDWATLREFCRFMALLCRELGGAAASSAPGHEQQQSGPEWLEDLLACEAFAGKLLFCLKNCIDPEMLSQAWHLAYTATYHSWRVWATLDLPLLEHSIMESFEGGMREDLPHCRVDSLCGMEYCLRTLEVHISRVEGADGGASATKLSHSDAHRRQAGQSSLLASLEGVLLDDSLALPLRTSGGLVLSDLLDLLSTAPPCPSSTTPASSPQGQATLRPNGASTPRSPPTPPTTAQVVAQVLGMPPTPGHLNVRVVLPSGALPRGQKGQCKALMNACLSVTTNSLHADEANNIDMGVVSRLVALLPLCIESPRYAADLGSCLVKEHHAWVEGITQLLALLEAHPQLSTLDAEDVTCARQSIRRACTLLHQRAAADSTEAAAYGELCARAGGPGQTG